MKIRIIYDPNLLQNPRFAGKVYPVSSVGIDHYMFRARNGLNYFILKSLATPCDYINRNKHTRRKVNNL